MSGRNTVAGALVDGRDAPGLHGVVRRRLDMFPDARGSFTEVFRRSWDSGVDPTQWSIAVSEKGVLRGVHVHRSHDDYLVIVAGRAAVGLCDLRPGSPSEGRSELVELTASELTALVIPRGVAHGFYFPERSIFLNGSSGYWDPSDDLGCHWKDPDLGIRWPVDDALLSARDAAAPTLRELRRRLAADPPDR